MPESVLIKIKSFLGICTGFAVHAFEFLIHTAKHLIGTIKRIVHTARKILRGILKNLPHHGASIKKEEDLQYFLKNNHE
jgi:hypothetical protein